MRMALLLVFGVIFLSACGADDDRKTSASERMVIHTRMVIAATEGAEPIATGEVAETSTIGDSAFCAGGKIRDSHARTPAMKRVGPIARTITCPTGTLKIGLAPEVGPAGPSGKGTWTIVRGTGDFEGLHGRGRMSVAMDAADESLGRETLTATVTR